MPKLLSNSKNAVCYRCNNLGATMRGGAVVCSSCLCPDLKDVYTGFPFVPLYKSKMYLASLYTPPIIDRRRAPSQLPIHKERRHL